MTKFEAWITQKWQDKGIANLIVTRTRDDGRTDLGCFTVDLGCLGAKDAFLCEDVSNSEFQEILDQHIPTESRERIHPSCAKLLIEKAVAYAEGLGFLPGGEFKKARKALSGIDSEACDLDITFGKAGKPFFIAGPKDSKERIETVMRILKTKFGPQGFGYALSDVGDEDDPADEFDDDALTDDDDDLDDDFPDEDELEAALAAEGDSAEKIESIRTDLRTFIETQQGIWPSFEHFLGTMTAMQACPEKVSPLQMLELLPGCNLSLFKDALSMKEFIDNFDCYWKSLNELLALEVLSGPSASSPIDLYEDEYDSSEEIISAHIEWSRGFLTATLRFAEEWGLALKRKDLAQDWGTIRFWAESDVDNPSKKMKTTELDKAILHLFSTLNPDLL